MVNEMIHHHASDDHHAQHSEDFLTTSTYLPLFHYVLIADRRQRRPLFRRFFIKRRQKLLPIFSFRLLVRRLTVRRSIVEFFSMDGHGCPARKRSNVTSQPSERAGLLVWLPVPLLVGDAFQSLTRVFHFLVEFAEHRLADSHG